MSALHAELIERSFSQQAPAFEDRSANRLMTTDSAWVFERLELRKDDLVLDVASGNGHAAQMLAPSVAGVIALDATQAMLDVGRRQAKSDGLDNVDFLQGDAARLPFEDGTFDVIVCRYAIHHFEEPQVQLAEMLRCLKDGGRLAIADIVADPDPAIASAQNHLEWLRDPSHARMLTAEQLTNFLDRLGMRDIDLEVRSFRRALEPWMEQTGTSESVAGSIVAKLRAELGGGPQTGFRPRTEGDLMSFMQTFASVLATKPVWRPVIAS